MKVLNSEGEEVTIFKDVGLMINTHVENLNDSGKRQNIASSIGYLFAAITAFFSAYLTTLP